MTARSRMALPKLSLALILLLSVILAGFIPFVPRFIQTSAHAPQSKAFLEYFVAYLSTCMFIICVRRFHLQRTKDFLFWGLGFFTLVIFQVFQNIAFPGFHDFSWFPQSVNAGVAFDVISRLLFAGYFLVGILGIEKRLLQPTRRNLVLIYSNALAFVIFVLVCFANFLPNAFFAAGGPTLLKRALEAVAAGVMVLSAFYLVRRFGSERQLLYFWFTVAAVFGVFTNLYLSLWQALYDPYFIVGHVLKILFFSSFLVGIFAEHLRFFKIEAELRESLERSREDLEKSEQTFRGLVENMADGFVVTDEMGVLIFCNQAFAAMLDDKPENLVNQHFSKFFYGKHYERIDLETLRREGKGGKFEVEFLTRNGERRPALIHATTIVESDGRKAGLQAVVTNLSERKKFETNLQNLIKEKNQTIALFKQCLENATDGVLIVNLHGRIVYLNRAFERMSGFSRSELTKQKTTALLYGRESEDRHQKLWKTVQKGQIWKGELRTRTKDGNGLLSEVSVVPIQDDNGRTINFLWVQRDIARQRTLEKTLEDYAEALNDKSRELEATRAYYDGLVSGISEIIVVVDNEGQCTFLNEYGASKLGYDAEELTAERLPSFFEDLKRLDQNYGTALRMEIADYEAPIRTKSGDTILCSWHARPLFDRDRRRIGTMAVGRDITEFKEMQRELEEYTRNLENKVKARTFELQSKVDQLARLLEIGEEIKLNVDVDVILNKIGEAVQSLGWRKVVISVRDYETRTSRVVAAVGLDARQLEKVMSWGDVPFEHTEKYLREEFRISNSYFLDHHKNEISRNAPFSVYSDLGERGQDEWHSLDALLVPIRTADRILGIISVDDPADRRRPSIDKVRDLELFADKAALAIENARLFQVQKESERHAKLLAELSQSFHASLQMDEVLRAIVTKGGRLMGEFCSLLLTDEESDTLVPRASFHEDPEVVSRFLEGSRKYPAKAGQGLFGQVMATGKPWMSTAPLSLESPPLVETPFHDLQPEFRVASVMVLPLKIRDRKMGVMLFATSQRNRRYRSRDLKLAQDLSERAALAIENARLFQEAGEKARELERANKLKTEFLANVSHELRTPLNAIITLSDILIREIPGRLNEEQVKQLQIIQKSGRNLLNLINDILDLSKIEAGRVEPVCSEVPIRAVLEETVEHVRPLCTEKGLALQFECAEDVPEMVWTDQDKLVKAVTNVLSNAVKFTPEGEVRLSLAMANPDHLRIRVADTGIGIPKERIPEIFKEFHQIDGTDAKKYGGTGLGLAITYKMVEILGGRISVESEVGKGSVFEITIPVQSPAEDKLRRLFKTDSDKLALELTDDRQNLDADKRTVLVIDDEEEAVYILRQYLHENGFQVIFPQNGENVFELARRYRPFAITLDLLMPDQSGWDVLDILQTNPDTRDIPVIVASVLPEEQKALRRGAAGYLQKPVEPKKLAELLASLEERTTKKKGKIELPSLFSLKKLSDRKFFGFGRAAPHVNGTVRILLVDDDLDTRYALRYALEEAGYEVYLATDGEAAVKQAKEIQPRIILMDMMMPGVDGYEATRQIKSRSALKHIPIIAITAKAMKGDREQVLAAGCDDYIAKPFLTGEVLALVQKWLQAEASPEKPA